MPREGVCGPTLPVPDVVPDDVDPDDVERGGIKPGVAEPADVVVRAAGRLEVDVPPDAESGADAPVADVPDTVEAAGVPAWSDSRVAWAWASAACACVTAPWKLVRSSVAKVCPADTRSPTDTATDATDPGTPKVAAAWSTRCADPVSSSTCWTDPLLTVAVR